MFSTLFFSAVSAKLSVQVELFASNSGQCGGPRFLRVAVEFDPCAMSQGLCDAMASVDCDMMEQGLRDLKDMMPDQPIPTFDECFTMDMDLLEEEEQEILDCLPTAQPTTISRRRAPALDMRVVRQFQGFLQDVVMPSMATQQRRMDLSGLEDGDFFGLNDFTMGDMKLKCGGTHISSMSAAVAGGITFGVMALIMGVLSVAFCSLYDFKSKAANGAEGDLEMAGPVNTSGEGQTSPKVDV